MTFFVGQKVVCVSDTYEGYGARTGRPITYRFHKQLTVGSVYTIRGLGYPRNPNNDLILTLEELVHPRKNNAGFPAACFKPVKEIKTDISIFTKILNTNHKELVS